MKNFDQFESIIDSVLNYCFAKNLKKNNFKIKRSINYFENQNLDKELEFRIQYILWIKN